MTRYIWDKARQTWAKPKPKQAPSGAFVLGDAEGFKSPIDGSFVEGRTALREHEARHQVRQIGNDYSSDTAPDWWDQRHN